ncbi:MAG: hypothetical protein R3C59_29325 [Planctomycetaceae bacterium]
MRFVLVMCLTTFVSGCGGGDDGPDRFRVSGVVTFNGQPVPAGNIYFETTAGPAGGAQIVNGAYDTSDGKGVVGGPHNVVIEGYDGNGENPGEMGKPLFKPFRVTETFDKSDSTKDFEVPASAADGLVISNDPA